MLAVNPALDLAARAPTRACGLSFEYVQSEFTPDSGIPLVNGAIAGRCRARARTSRPFDVSDQDVYRLRLDARAPAVRARRLRDKAYYTELNWDSDGTLIAGRLPRPRRPDRRRAHAAAAGRPAEVARQPARGHARFAHGQRAAHAAGRPRGAAGSPTSSRSTSRCCPPIDLVQPGRDGAAAAVPDPAASRRRATRARSSIAPYVMDRIDLGASQVAGRRAARPLDFEEDARAHRARRHEAEPAARPGVRAHAAGCRSTRAAGTAFAPALEPGGRRARARGEPASSRRASRRSSSAAGPSRPRPSTTSRRTTSRSPTPRASRARRATSARAGSRLELQAEAQPGLFATAVVRVHRRGADELQRGWSFLGRAAAVLPGERPLGQHGPRSRRATSFNAWLVKELRGGLPARRGRALRRRAVHRRGQPLRASTTTSCSTPWPRTGAAASRARVHFKNLTGHRVRDARLRRRSSVIPASPFAVYGRSSRAGRTRGTPRGTAAGERTDGGSTDVRMTGRARDGSTPGCARWWRGTSIPRPASPFWLERGPGAGLRPAARGQRLRRPRALRVLPGRVAARRAGAALGAAGATRAGRSTSSRPAAAPACPSRASTSTTSGSTTRRSARRCPTSISRRARTG